MHCVCTVPFVLTLGKDSEGIFGNDVPKGFSRISFFITLPKMDKRGDFHMKFTNAV